MAMRYTLFSALLFATFALLAACGGGSQQNAPLPVVATNAPGAGGAPTVDGFPVSIKEFALPDGQGGPNNPVVGPDGAIWFSAGYRQMDRITGSGAITVFTAPSAPPGNPDGTWYPFGESVSYAGNIFTQFIGEGGEWGHTYGLFLARVTLDGSITPSINVGPDIYFRGMRTDSSGGLWVLTASDNGYLERYSWNGTTWSARGYCFISNVDVFTLAYGPDGNLYVAGDAQPLIATILKISPYCKTLAAFTVPALTLPPSNPYWNPAMTFGADGNLWILTRGTANIDRMTTSGTFTRYTVPFPGSAPVGITRGSDGAIWFTDAGTNAVGRLTTSGSFSEFPVPTPNAFGGGGIVSCPQKCDGAHGRVWFSEDGASKIGRLEF